jgi:3-phenylpropionate/cinnamic acid dioxygenase small subunit
MDTTDVLAIHALIARYGHVVDDAEWERLTDVFSTDGVFDLDAIGRGVATGTEELRACFAQLDHPVAHHTTNVVVDPTGDASARVRSKYLVVFADGRTGTGEYRDEVVDGPDGWRIRRRTAVPRRRPRRSQPEG